MVFLILGILVFLGVHSVRMIAPNWRDQQVSARGVSGWKGPYAVIAIVGLGLIIYGFGQARPEAMFFYEPPSFMRHIAHGLMLIAFVSIAASSFPAGKIKAVLKHPMITGVKIWAFAHLLVNGDLASMLLFGSFLAWTIWNRIVVKRRGDPIPEAGPMINDAKALVVGVALYALFAFWAHEFLIGVTPF